MHNSFWTKDTYNPQRPGESVGEYHWRRVREIMISNGHKEIRRAGGELECVHCRMRAYPGTWNDGSLKPKGSAVINNCTELHGLI
jgi:hypothetical protein